MKCKKTSSAPPLADHAASRMASARGHLLPFLFAGMMLAISGCSPLNNNQAQTTNVVPMITPQKDKLNTFQHDTWTTPEVIWREGEWWKYDDGYFIQVSHVDKKTGVTDFSRLDVAKPAKSWIKRLGFFKEESLSPNGIRRRVLFRSQDPIPAIYPLKIGNEARFRREFEVWEDSNGRNKDVTKHTHETSWRVVERTRIEVPAGRFTCWVLEWRSHNPATGWFGFERWYFSMEAKNYVRMEYKYGNHPSGARVLLEYGNEEVPPPPAAQVAIIQPKPLHSAQTWSPQTIHPQQVPILQTNWN